MNQAPANRKPMKNDGTLFSLGVIPNTSRMTGDSGRKKPRKKIAIADIRQNNRIFFVLMLESKTVSSPC